MKKKLFAFIFLLVIFLQVSFAQNYYYLPKTGTTADFQYYVNWKVVMDHPSTNGVVLNDSLSAWQTLPFSWNFYGKPVTGYYISDNGYITFDQTATQSDPKNITIPSSNAPKNAIFALWDSLTLVAYSTYPEFIIHTWTYGSAPNRIHVIHWYNAQHETGTTSTSARFSAAVRIYENGPVKFDIVYNWRTYNNPKTSATVGCQNDDASKGTMVTGSPNYVYPLLGTALEDDVVFEFYEGTQPSFDLALQWVDIHNVVDFGKENSINAVLRNMGSQTINFFDVKFKFDSDSSVNYFNTTLPPGSVINVQLNNLVPKTGKGSYHELIVWGGNIDGGLTDAVPENDTLKIKVFVNNGTGKPGKVLIEEFSTVPCGFCPDGHIILDSILSEPNSAIGMCHHAGFGTDAMTIPANTAIANAFTNGAPTATFNRHKYANEQNVAIGRFDWRSALAERSSILTPVDLQIYGTFDSSSKALNANVRADFIDFASPGTLGISFFIVEDHVSNGTGTNWDQHSYFYNTTGHPLYHVGIYDNGKGYATISKYDHRHVVMACLSATWGDTGIISWKPIPGTYFTKNYQTNIDPIWNTDSIYLVAFVSYFNTNTAKREILNAYQVSLKNMPATYNSVENETENKNISVYPNPACDRLFLDLSNETETFTSAEIYSVTGKVLKQIRIDELYSHRYEINISDLQNGLYFLRVKSSNGQYAFPVIKQ